MDKQKINTIEMTRKIRDAHAKRLAGKSHAERMAYYRERARKMQKKIPAFLSARAALGVGQVDHPTASTATAAVREKRGAYKTKK
jgi:hypothetical protein